MNCRSMARLVARALRVHLLLLSIHSSFSSASCYCVDDGTIAICGANSIPCSNSTSTVQLCCAAGDICGADSICQFTHPQADVSGYYVGGCTDPTFSDPVCSKRCSMSEQTCAEWKKGADFALRSGRLHARYCVQQHLWFVGMLRITGWQNRLFSSRQ